MGNDESLIQSKPDKINYYGSVLTRNQKTLKSYQHFFVEERHYSSFRKLILSRKNLYHQNFATIQNFWKKQTKNGMSACQLINKIEICVQHSSYELSLSKLLDSYAQNNQLLKEKQIKQIFYSVVSCLKYLRSKQTCHGDIKPSKIFFNRDGKVRLLDSFFICGGKTSYEIVMQDPQSMSLLSGQQLQRLKDRQFDSVSQIHANQIFSVAMCMYQCMTFQSAMECYDLDKLTLKKDFLKGKDKLMLGNGYSSSLVNIVLERIISKSAKQRMHFDQLLNVLKT